MTKLLSFSFASAAALAVANMAAAAPILSGQKNGISWQASNEIVAFDSTATVVGGGNPIYLPDYSAHSGVVALIMEYDGIGTSICSGSLIDRRNIVTAAHCVTNGPGLDRPDKVTAYFYDGPNPETIVPGDPAATAIDVTNIFVEPNYTGEVIDENDIAVVLLREEAPAFAQSYDLYLGDDLGDQIFNIAGYGLRSLSGGIDGTNPASILGPGRLRQAFNSYDFRLGDPNFFGFWDGFFGSADVDNVWLYDFDSGVIDNNSACILGANAFGTLDYCTSVTSFGLGIFEGQSAGGDSGGPQFLNGLLASVTSFGLSFGMGFGDLDNSLNDTFGEFSGVVPIYAHIDFIRQAQVPAPAAIGLLGLGLFGVAARRRKARSA